MAIIVIISEIIPFGIPQERSKEPQLDQRRSEVRLRFVFHPDVSFYIILL